MDSPLSTFAVQRAGNLPRSFADTGSALLSRARVCGRVVEVSEAGAFGAMSALCPLIAEVQARGEPVAWVEAGPSVFFPPDLHFLGIDVEAIPVFWSPEAKAGLQATDWLVRSGAFGLVVADWGTHKVDDALLGRLARLAQEQSTTVVFLTRKESAEASLGALVSLRVAVSKVPGDGQGSAELVVLKDKKPGAALQQRMSFDGPLGLY
ncbi:MAG: hypothetical protein WCG80_15850 [Spirochaetales bacterium]